MVQQIKRGTVPVRITPRIGRAVAKWLRAGHPSSLLTVLNFEDCPREMRQLAQDFDKIARSRRGKREIRLSRHEVYRLWYWASRYTPTSPFAGSVWKNEIDRKLPATVQQFAAFCLAAYSTRPGNKRFRRYSTSEIEQRIPLAKNDRTLRRLVMRSRLYSTNRERGFPTALD